MIGDSLAYAHSGRAGDHVVQRFDVLYVDGGDYRDIVTEKFEDVFVAFAMLRPGNIGVGQLIDDANFRTTSDDAIEIHLLECYAAVFNPAHGDAFEAFRQGRGFGATVRFKHGYNYVDALP